MIADAFFARVEDRQVADSTFFRRLYGTDVPAYDRSAPRPSPSADNLALFANERCWSEPRYCACGYSTTWPPALGAHQRWCNGEGTGRARKTSNRLTKVDVAKVRNLLSDAVGTNQIEDDAGLARGQIYYLLKRGGGCHRNTLHKLADALGVSAAEIEVER